MSQKTMQALQHTLAAVNKLLPYMLEDLKMKYVPRAKRSSRSPTLLQCRFSQCRRSSWGTINMENEKKLKLTRLLSVASASKGSIQAKEFGNMIHNPENRSLDTAYEADYFFSMLPACDEVAMRESQNCA